LLPFRKIVVTAVSILAIGATALGAAQALEKTV
jgi:hypothetical protein